MWNKPNNTVKQRIFTVVEYVTTIAILVILTIGFAILVSKVFP